MESTKDILLSIIVPVYNVQDYIRQCIESLFCQDLDDNCFEIIIINDGSTDRSMEMIEDIVGCHNNITIINQENQGLSMARNNGIALARGEYLLMPDSDDLLLKNTLKPLLKKALETKVDLLVADYIAISDNEMKKNIPIQQPETITIETTGKKLFADIHHINNVWRTIYRKDFLIENNISFIPGIYFEDVPFTNKCYLYAHKCIKTNVLLYIYRKRDASITSANTFTMRKARDLCISMAKTWELRNDKKMTQELQAILNEHVYVLFHNLLYRTIFSIEPTSNKITVLKTLLDIVPDLKFSNGYKRHLITFLFRKLPRLYIYALLLRKRIIWRL